MLPVFSCFMYSVLNSFFRLSACLTANAVCRQHIPHRDHYLVAVVAMGMRLWFTQSVAYFERIICYMNAKHVLYVLLLWVRFPYWEMPFWVIMYRVVDITTTHHVITQKNTVLIYRGADKSLAWPDWKNFWEVAIFRLTWRSLLPRRPVGRTTFWIFFWVSCKS